MSVIQWIGDTLRLSKIYAQEIDSTTITKGSVDLLIPSYAGITVTDNATAETTVDATARVIAAWDTVTPVADCTASGSVVTVGADGGDYAVFASGVFNGSIAKKYRIAVYIGGVESDLVAEIKIGAAATDPSSVSLSGIVTLAGAAVIDLRQSATDGGTALTMIDGQLLIKR